MKRLEERVTCEDDAGQRYDVEVYREVTRREDDTQELGPREAFIAGDPPRPVRVFDDQDTFQTQAGKVLRRLNEPDQPENNRADRRSDSGMAMLTTSWPFL